MKTQELNKDDAIVAKVIIFEKKEKVSKINSVLNPESNSVFWLSVILVVGLWILSLFFMFSAGVRYYHISYLTVSHFGYIVSSANYYFLGFFLFTPMFFPMLFFVSELFTDNKQLVYLISLVFGSLIFLTTVILLFVFFISYSGIGYIYYRSDGYCMVFQLLSVRISLLLFLPCSVVVFIAAVLNYAKIRLQQQINLLEKTIKQ